MVAVQTFRNSATCSLKIKINMSQLISWLKVRKINVLFGKYNRKVTINANIKIRISINTKITKSMKESQSQDNRIMVEAVENDSSNKIMIHMKKARDKRGVLMDVVIGMIRMNRPNSKVTAYRRRSRIIESITIIRSRKILISQICGKISQSQIKKRRNTRIR